MEAISITEPSQNAAIELCPVCAAKDSERLFYHGKEKIPIVRCKGCGLQYSARYFSSAQLRQFYGEQYFHGQYGYADYHALEQMKRRTFGSRLDSIAQLFNGRPAIKFLDVGCASGLLVKMALERAWDAYGIDISSAIIEAAAPELKARLRSGTLADIEFEADSFDVITMSDLIEHVHTPLAVIEEVSRLLRDNGLLFIETPNTHSLTNRLMGKSWPLYRPPEHLVYFSPALLSKVLSDRGFRVETVRGSWKAVSVEYVLDKLAPTNPFFARAARSFQRFLPGGYFWMPVGSFWLIARKDVGVRPVA